MFVSKIKNLADIVDISAQLKKKGIKVGFTNGCFDILHAGHVSYLNKAKSLVDVLILGLNSDDSIRRIKGKNRPINNQEDRALVVASLECIDFVVLFSEDTPENLIKAIKPDMLIKGADWKNKTVAGCDFVQKYGGKCEFIELLNNRSTTNIIEKIVNEYC